MIIEKVPGLTVASTAVAGEMAGRVCEFTNGWRIIAGLSAAGLTAFMLWLDSEGQQSLGDDPDLFKY